MLSNKVKNYRQKSQKLFEEAIERNKWNISYPHYLASLFFQTGENEKALEWYDYIKKYDPDYAEIHYSSAALYDQLSNKERDLKAKADYRIKSLDSMEKALTFKQSDEYYFFYAKGLIDLTMLSTGSMAQKLSEAPARTATFADAQKAIDKAFSYDENSMYGYLGTSYLLIAKGEYDKATDILVPLNLNYPKNYRVFEHLKNIVFSSGKKLDYKRFYLLLKLDQFQKGKNWRVRREIGKGYESFKNYERALVYYYAAYQQQPKDLFLTYRIGTLLLKTGQKDKAADFLKATIKLAPNSNQGKEARKMLQSMQPINIRNR